jgi:hypothetical protein
MRFTTVFYTICLVATFGSGAAGAQGLPDLGQAASSAASAAGQNAVDSVKQTAADKLNKAKDSGATAILKACADQAESEGLTGRALRKYVASCKKSGGPAQ